MNILRRGEAWLSAAARLSTRIEALLYPTAEDGQQGMSFIDACVRSHEVEGRWTAL